jgi:hypothetical protein
MIQCWINGFVLGLFLMNALMRWREQLIPRAVVRSTTEDRTRRRRVFWTLVLLALSGTVWYSREELVELERRL